MHGVKARVATVGCALALALVAGCGGASSEAGTRAPGGSNGVAGRDGEARLSTPSIGDTAAAQGGLTALGGGANANPAPVETEGSSTALRLDRGPEGAALKLDGLLDEWPRRVLAGTRVQGQVDPSTSFAAAVLYDDTALYVGGDVEDDAFVRTSRFDEDEDHASLIVAFPLGPGAGFATYEVAFFAGRPGRSAGAVRFASGGRRGQDVPGARIVEAPTGSGYTFEARLPWSVFPEARAVRVGLRGAARLYDSDQTGVIKSIVATGRGGVADIASLPRLPTEPESAIEDVLLAPRGLGGKDPRIDLVIDVAGDARKERVSVFGNLITVCGAGYRGGRAYFVRELADDVVRLEARRLTGGPHDDLLVHEQHKGASGAEGAGAPTVTRDAFEVWSFLGGRDEPVTTFEHEIAVTSGPNRVTNAVHVAGRDIEVATESATGWDARSFKEPPEANTPVLLPWGTVRSQIYRFDGSHFVVAKEVTQPGVPIASGRSSAPAREAARVEEPETPTVTKEHDLSSQVFALYRREHPSQAAPRFAQKVQIAGDPQPEQVVLVDRDLVVYGPGVKNGTGYAAVTLQDFASAADIQDLTARDLTGDGAADLTVRGVRRVTAAAPKGVKRDGLVEMDMLLVYSFSGASLGRVFGIETGRAVGVKRVQGLVQFMPTGDHQHFEIDVRPGLAKGWTEKTYPWSQEPPGRGALEPLLLPWGGIDHLRYRWSGSAFVLAP